MSGDGPVASRPSAPVPAVPSKDGLRLILAGTTYLLAICVLQLVVFVDAVAGGPAFLPANVMEIRDVVALFGWVGLMISGVAVIIVPNHLKVRVRPTYLPRVHLGLANVGLAGYLAATVTAPGSAKPEIQQAQTTASIHTLGVGVLATVYPFARRPVPQPRVEALARAPGENLA